MIEITKKSIYLLYKNALNMKIIKYLPLLLGAAAIFSGHNSCTVEDLDIENVNTDSLYLKTGLDVPVAQITASIKDIMKHDRSKGVIYTPDTTYVITDAVKEHIKLPATILKGSRLDERDTFPSLYFDHKIGDGHAINQVETCVLKMEVENGLPFSVDFTIKFFHRDTLTGITTGLVELRKDQSFTAGPAAIDENTYTVSKTTKTKHRITFDKTFTAPLKEVDQIDIDYKFHMDTYDQVIVTEKDVINMKTSCYFKGGIPANEYNF